MNKVIKILLCLFVIFSLFGCGSKNDDPVDVDPIDDKEEEIQQNEEIVQEEEEDVSQNEEQDETSVTEDITTEDATLQYQYEVTQHDNIVTLCNPVIEGEIELALYMDFIFIDDVVSVITCRYICPTEEFAEIIKENMLDSSDFKQDSIRIEGNVVYADFIEDYLSDYQGISQEQLYLVLSNIPEGE